MTYIQVFKINFSASTEYLLQLLSSSSEFYISVLLLFNSRIIFGSFKSLPNNTWTLSGRVSTDNYFCPLYEASFPLSSHVWMFLFVSKLEILNNMISMIVKCPTHDTSSMLFVVFVTALVF